MHDVTRLPTRREMSLVRSRDMHARRIEAAPTLDAQVLAAIAELRAVLASDHPDDKALTAAHAVEAIRAVSDAARARAGTRARRRVSHVRAA